MGSDDHTDGSSTAHVSAPIRFDHQYVTRHALGILNADDEMTVIIPAHSPIPISRRKVFEQDEENELLVEVLEGDSIIASEDKLLGVFTLRLPPKTSTKQFIYIIFEMNSDGLLEVRAECERNSVGITILRSTVIPTQREKKVNQNKSRKKKQDTNMIRDYRLMDGVSAPSVSGDVLDLLLFALHCANISARREAILRPKPIIKDWNQLYREIVSIQAGTSGNSSTPNGQAIISLLVSSIPCPIRLLSSASSYETFRQSSPSIASALEWLASSSSSYIERVPQELNVPYLQTDRQYHFVSETPAKQKEFEKLAIENQGKTRFLFHGSRAENWHAIIREGLRNMSGTPHQLNGASYGRGIYASPQLATSMGYTANGASMMRSSCADGRCCLSSGGNNAALHIVALVEVVDRPEAYTMPAQNITVVKEEKWCSVRMLLVYSGQTRGILRNGPGKNGMPDLTKMTDEEKRNIWDVVHKFKTTGVAERSRLSY